MKKNEADLNTISIKHIWILSFMFSTIVLLLFLRYILQLKKENLTGILFWIKSSNFNLYFVILIIFLLSFLVGRFVFFHTPKWGRYLSGKLENAICKAAYIILVAGFLFLLLNWLFVQQYFEFSSSANSLPISTVPLGYILVIFVIGLALVIWVIRENKDCSPNFVKPVYALCLVLIFWGLYIPNFFVSDYYHGVAAIESIYNVADLTPFTYLTTGIYGHYGIFFYVPLKLVGCTIESVVALMALSGCVAYASVLYVIHNLMPRNWLRIMAAIASLFVLVIRRSVDYWQVQPIRVVFPSIFMAYAVYFCKSKYPNYKVKVLFGWLLGVLAVLWNTETGFFCVVAFVAFLLTDYWSKYKWYEKKMWPLYIGSIVFIVSAVVGAVVLLNIYNLICGGPLVFRTFFFPLLVDRYMNESIRYDLVWGNHAWIYVLLMFFILFCWGLYHTQWFRKNSEQMWNMAPAAVLTGVLGLLNFSYYANRAAFANLEIVFQIAICANTFVIAGLWPQFIERQVISFDVSCKKAGVTVCLIVLFGLSIQLLYAPVRIKERHENGYQSTISLRKEINQFSKMVPENTYGIGGGISTIYHILGWDNYGHFRDAPDLTIGGETYVLDKVVEDTLQNDSFVLGTSSAKILNKVLENDWHYQLEATISIQGKKFQYYVKKPYAVSAKVDEENALIQFTFRDDDIYSSIIVTLWNAEDGQDSLDWISLQKNENGIWEGNIDFQSFPRTGNYIVEFYSDMENSSNPIIATSVEVTTLSGT